MIFFQLINSSFRRNSKIYAPYLLSTSILVAINYIFAAIAANHSLKHLHVGAAVGAIIIIGQVFVILVTLAFILYINRFLWQQRRREMGLYSMLGMTSKDLSLLVIIEKCYLLIGSLICGLVTGIVFEKLAFLGLSRLLAIHHLHQPWISMRGLGQTVLIITGYFFILIITDLFKLQRLNPRQLWHSTVSQPARHGWLFTLAGLLGILLLAGAYWIVLTIKPKLSSFSSFMFAVILVVIGTYLVFIAGSIIILKALQKNKRFYYHPHHFIAVSGMLQRMEQNGASLATICLLCSSVLVILFSTITLYAGINSTANFYAPQDVVMTTSRPLTVSQHNIISNTAAKHHAKIIDRTQYTATASRFGYWRGNSFINEGALTKMSRKTTASVIFVTSKTYNRLTGNHVQLDNRHALIYSPAHKHSGKLTIAGNTYQTKPINRLSFALNPEHSIYSPFFVIVNRLPQKLPTMTVTSFNYRLKGSENQHISFENALQQNLNLQDMWFNGWHTIHSLFSGLYGGLVFIGILISLALGVTTTIVIYFKQVSEGYADRRRFHTMQQVGLSEKETTKSIHSQVLMVFMLPIIGAVINLAFAFPAIRQIMMQLNFYNFSLMATTALTITIALLAAYLFIYGLTTKIYHQIVDN